MIKRQIDDSVERQPEKNQEEEPAEFIVLKFEDQELQIFSEKNTVAEQARTSINRTADDIEFDHPRVTVNREEAAETVSGLMTGETDLADSPVTVTGFKLGSSPFPNHPSVQMKSDAGIIETVEGLQEAGYDVTDSIDDIERIYLDFEGREYRIYPEEVEHSSEDFHWLFRYNARYLDDEEREQFENEIEEALGIDMVLENS